MSRNYCPLKQDDFFTGLNPISCMGSLRLANEHPASMQALMVQSWSDNLWMLIHVLETILTSFWLTNVSFHGAVSELGPEFRTGHNGVLIALSYFK